MSGIYSTNKIKNLNQLNDVNLTDLSNDEVIKYNSTTGLWENGSAGVENISELNDVSITSEANNELLKYNSTSGKWENTDTIDVEEANIDRWLIRNLVPGVCAMGYDTVYSANQNSYAFAQQDDGATFINCKSGKTIYFVHGNNNTLMTMNNTVISLNRELEFKTGVELKTNGSYGTTGAVLTSRGTNNSPIWTEPYYFSASLSADQSVANDSPVDINFAPYLSPPYNGNNGDMTSGIWTCPTQGLYKVNFRATVVTSGDDIRQADIWLIKNDGVIDTGEANASYFNNVNDDIQVGTLNCETLVEMSPGHTLRGNGRIVISSGGGRAFRATGVVNGGRATELTITRVI